MTILLRLSVRPHGAKKSEAMKPDRRNALALIKSNIEKSGFHIYLVAGHGPTPRLVYTIGLRESLGAELVLAGAIYFKNKEDVLEIVHSVRNQLSKGTEGKLGPIWHSTFEVRGLGSFTLRKAHISWTRSLLLGATDYYGIKDVDAYQIVPEEKHRTVDVPNMAREWSATAEPIWKWLHESWSYPVPEASTAMTNLDALRGAPITEACRWEEDHWELFAGAGPDVAEGDARLVPLACLLAGDPSLVRVADLKIGECIWRDGEDGDWTDWKRRETSD